MTLRIVFMGTPEFAVPTLGAIIAEGFEVVAAYTQPARAAGRGQKPRNSPVQDFAETHNIPVVTTPTLKDFNEQLGFMALNADVAVVVAYGLILPPEILAMPTHGCLNLHASKLPRWRGAAPIQRSIMAGDTDTAVSVMRMEEGLDTGPVCLEESVAIDPNMTAGALHDILATRGADLVVRALSALSRDKLECVPQSDEGVTYASKIEKSEGKIDWSKPAGEVHNQIRGLSPFPGAWFEIDVDGAVQRIKVLASENTDGEGPLGTVLDDNARVACGEGAVRLKRLQRAGKQSMDSDEFLRGLPLPAGTVLV